MFLPLCAVHTASAATCPFSSHDRLNGVIVRNIHQDTRGHIWLATDSGLWRTGQSGFEPLADPCPVRWQARCIVEDTRGHLWVGISNGLIALDMDALDRVPEPRWLNGLAVLCAVIDETGVIWVGTVRGLYRLDSRAFSNPDLQPVPVEGTEGFGIWALAIDGRRRLWVGAEGALFVVDISEPGAAGVATRRFDQVVAEHVVEGLCAAGDGTLWIGLRHNGGGLYRLRGDELTPMAGQHGLRDTDVNDIIEDNAGGIWLGTENGVFWWDRDHFVAIDHTHGLPNTDIHSLLCDREGQIWIGSYGGGLTQLCSPYVMVYGLPDGLPHPTITALTVDSKGRLVAGTVSNAFRFDLDGPSIDTLAPGHLDVVHITPDGETWLAGPRGVWVDGEKLQDVRLGRVRSITGDPDGRVHFATHDGRLYQLTNHVPTQIPGPPGRVGPFNVLAFQPDGTMLLGTQAGLFRRRDDTWQALLLGHDVRAILPAPDGGVWVGTVDGLLKLAGGDSNAIETLAADGVEIRQLALDRRDVLWAATADGLLRSRAGRLDHLTVRDGLPSGDVRCLVVDRRGRLFAGTTQGLAHIDAERFDICRAPPRIEIIRFVAGGREWMPARPGPELRYANRDVLAQVRTIGWRSNAGMRYRYRLDGHGDQWSDLVRNDIQRYSDLAPGTYTLRVRGVNEAGIEAERGADLTFTVLPPVWHAVWFLAVAVFVVAITVGLGVALYFKLFPVARRTVLGVFVVSCACAGLASLLGAHDALERQTRSLEKWRVDDWILFFPLSLALGLVWAVSRTARRAQNELANRERTEGDLRASEERFRSVVASASDAIVLADDDGKIVSWNNAARSMFGYSRDEIISKPLTVLIPDRFHESHRAGMRVLQTSGRSAIIEKTFDLVGRKKDGTEFHVEPSLSTWTVGGRSFYAAIMRDVTERRRIEEALRDSDERFRQLADHIRGVFWLVDLRQNKVVYASPGYESIWGRPLSGLYADRLDCTRIIHPDDRSRIIETFARNGEEAETYEVEYRIVRADGSIRWIHDRGFPILGSDGKVCRIAGIAEDITRRHRAEEQARQRQQELVHVTRLSTIGEMASGLAHEINQPLTAITNYARGCLRRMRAGTGDTAQLTDVIERIADQATRASDVIRSLRAFVRKEQAHRAPVDINAVVKEAAAIADADIKHTGIAVRLRLVDSPPPVLADAIQIEQVVLNLVRNAVEAMSDADDAPRRLTIETSDDHGSAVTVSVRDTGTVLSAQALEQAFEPFFTTKPEGIGMGLPISRTLIESFGGKLWAEANDGVGMVFGFSLPTIRGFEYDT